MQELDKQRILITTTEIIARTRSLLQWSAPGFYLNASIFKNLYIWSLTLSDRLNFFAIGKRFHRCNRHEYHRYYRDQT